MITMSCEDAAMPSKNYVNVFELSNLDQSQLTIDHQCTRRVKTSFQMFPGLWDGPDFRWAGAAHVDASGKLSIYQSARDFPRNVVGLSSGSLEVYKTTLQ